MKALFSKIKNILKADSGFALLPVILAIIISGLFLTAGLSLIDSKANQDKYNSSKIKMEKAGAALAAWAKETGRLPDASEFFSVTGISKDAWQNDIVYVYDDNLTRLSSGGICGRQSTGISTSTLSNIALILISRGNDYQLDSTPGTSGAYSGTPVLSPSDLIKTVTLENLQSDLCFTQHQLNQLRILNNELPYVCQDEAYTGTLFPQGGVSPYAWSCVSKPDWLTPGQSGNNYLFQGTPSATGTFDVAVVLDDAEGNRIEKSFDITVYECEEDPTDPKKPKKPKKTKKPKKVKD